MRYSVREAVEWVQNKASAPEDFSDTGSEENIVDSGKEPVPVDLKVDSSDSDNAIFIFMIGIRATSQIKLFFLLFGQFLLCCYNRERYMIWLWII